VVGLLFLIRGLRYKSYSNSHKMFNWVNNTCFNKFTLVLYLTLHLHIRQEFQYCREFQLSYSSGFSDSQMTSKSKSEALSELLQPSGSTTICLPNHLAQHLLSDSSANHSGSTLKYLTHWLIPKHHPHLAHLWSHLNLGLIVKSPN